MIRSVQNSSVRAESQEPPRRAVAPAGTSMRIRLIEPISENSETGDVLQGVTADPVLVDSQPLIPRGTRALLSLRDIKHRKADAAEVTLQLTELVSQSGKVPALSEPLNTNLKSLSDLNILARGLAAIIGGAVGAARSASAGRDLDVGAAIVGGQLAGAATKDNDDDVLLFRTTEPIDLAGIAW